MDTIDAKRLEAKIVNGLMALLLTIVFIVQPGNYLIPERVKVFNTQRYMVLAFNDFKFAAPGGVMKFLAVLERNVCVIFSVYE